MRVGTVAIAETGLGDAVARDMETSEEGMSLYDLSMDELYDLTMEELYNMGMVGRFAIGSVVISETGFGDAGVSE